MRTLSLMLACAFVLAGPSMAGPTETGLQGVGTFAYSGSPILVSDSQAVIVATR